MSTPLNAKSALVTGASRGIGAAIARRLATEGWALSISARSEEEVRRLAEELQDAGSPKVQALPADMADLASVLSLTTQHAATFGDLTALVLNAGIGIGGALERYPLDNLDRSVAVNFRAPVALVQACMPMLRAAAERDVHGGAKLIAITSIAGEHPEKHLSVYGATKAALGSFLDAFNREHSSSGIIASAIAPGYVDTSMSSWVRDRIPPDTMISVDDVAEIVSMLLKLSRRSMVSKLVVARSNSDGRSA